MHNLFHNSSVTHSILNKNVVVTVGGVQKWVTFILSLPLNAVLTKSKSYSCLFKFFSVISDMTNHILSVIR